MKTAVMQGKEAGHLSLSFFGGGNGVIIDANTFGRELFQAKYSSPVEKADDNTLAHHVGRGT